MFVKRKTLKGVPYGFSCEPLETMSINTVNDH